MIDSEALRTFLAIHGHKSFTLAAKALHRTQPAISHRMVLLEQSLGAPLFERTPNGIHLTEAGRVLLPYAERVVSVLEDGEAAVRALDTETTGPLTLAIVGSLAGTNLTQVLRRFAAAHPGLDLRLRTASSTEVSEFVRRGDASIGLRYDRDRSPDLVYEELGTERLRIVASPRHPRAGKTLAKLTQLSAERWLAFPEIPSRRRIWSSHIVSIFANRGIGDLDWLAVDSLTAQKRLVEAGYGIALMPESSLAEELAAATLSLIEVRDLTSANTVHLVTRKDGYLGKAARDAIALIRADRSVFQLTASRKSSR